MKEGIYSLRDWEAEGSLGGGFRDIVEIALVRSLVVWYWLKYDRMRRFDEPVQQFYKTL
jgi:hypothetical protein